LPKKQKKSSQLRVDPSLAALVLAHVLKRDWGLKKTEDRHTMRCKPAWILCIYVGNFYEKSFSVLRSVFS
jgi:hypothetical protein